LYRSGRVQEEVQEGDRYRIKLRFDGDEDVMQFALAYGGAVELVEPAVLRERILAVARTLVGRYAPGAAASPMPSPAPSTPAADHPGP
jgi:predicted DNA-binding transcriptional regulator YafY